MSRFLPSYRIPRLGLCPATVAGFVLLLFLLPTVAAYGVSSRPKHADYPYRLVYVSNKLQNDQQVTVIADIARRASQHGFNGIVLESSFDRIGRQRPEYFDRLRRIKQICEETEMAIIPRVFSVGYGQALLENDPNLAAAVPVKNQLFIVDNGEARVVADPAVHIAGGGFDKAEGERPASVAFQDRPGESSFIDRDVTREGRASLRFENFQGSEKRFARVMFKVAVQPFRSYRVTCWVKTEDLEPPGSFLVQALSKDDRVLMITIPKVERNTDWQEINMGLNTLDNTEVRLYAGVWTGQGGRFWIDGVRIEEVGLTNLLRRPGTPVTVRSEATGIVYREGEDYAPLADPHMDYTFYHAGPAIRPLPDGRISEGERLRVDYYQALSLKKGQMGVCPSEPGLYETWRNVVDRVEQHLAPQHYLIGADEVRHGGWCLACQSRGLSAGERLGDCVSRGMAIIREANPDADVFIWSDMFDPSQNARKDFYLAKGDYTGGWDHLPDDIIIACWQYKSRDQSLSHFSRLGFRTLACAYYDTGNLKNTEGWLKALDGTTGACGIMYTTWRNQYELLESFGDLVADKTASTRVKGR